MSSKRFRIEALASFQREAKPLLKKYPSLKSKLYRLDDLLAETPTSGISIGQNCYKIRLKISSKGKGSSGGAWIITCVVAVTETVFLLSIYDKSEQENIAGKRLQELLQAIPDRN